MRTAARTGSIILLVLVIAALAGSGCGKREAAKPAGKEAPPATAGADDTPAARYARGEAAFIAGRLDEAFAILRALPAGAPESARGHNLLGLIHARRNATALAALEFKEALGADPNLPHAHNNLGVLHLQEGRLDLAEAEFQAAVKADPYYIAPHQGLAEVYYKSGKTGEARTELELVDELRASAQAAAAGAPAGVQDLQLGQPLDVAELIEREQEAEKPQPSPAAPAKPSRRPKPASEPAPRPASPPAPATRTITSRLVAPTGTALTIALDQPISTATAQTGQEVRAHVVGDVLVGQDVLIKSGAAVRGRIMEVETSGRVKGRAALALEFTSVETAGGRAELHGHMVEGTLKAQGTKKRDVATVGIGAAAGAVLGEIFGDNAKLGALIGGAAGTAVVLTTKGKELELESGTELGLELDQPLAVTVTKTVPATE